MIQTDSEQEEWRNKTSEETETPHLKTRQEQEMGQNI